MIHAFPSEFSHRTFRSELRVKVRSAYKNLQRIKRDQVALLELPIAQLTSLTANINRDSKKTPKPFTLQDFALFHQTDKSDGLPPNAAMVALSLRRERLMPTVLVGVWPEVLAAAKEATAMPEVRALISDCGSVALLAPKPEGKGWRGLLAVDSYPPGGLITLRDVDRELLAYSLQLPPTDHMSFVSSDELLAAS